MTRLLTVGPAIRSPAHLRRGRLGRRVFVIALVVFVLAGGTLMFGERVDRVSATGGGYELTVEYPSRTRGGLTQDIDVLVRRRGGFDGPVTVALTAEYLRVFEQQGMQPQPSSSTATAARVEWTFDPPAGDTLRVLIDVRVEPHRHQGAAGRVSVLDGAVELAGARLETVVMP